MHFNIIPTCSVALAVAMLPFGTIFVSSLVVIVSGAVLATDGLTTPRLTSSEGFVATSACGGDLGSTTSRGLRDVGGGLVYMPSMRIRLSPAF